MAEKRDELENMEEEKEKTSPGGKGSGNDDDMVEDEEKSREQGSAEGATGGGNVGEADVDKVIETDNGNSLSVPAEFQKVVAVGNQTPPPKKNVGEQSTPPKSKSVKRKADTVTTVRQVRPLFSVDNRSMGGTPSQRAIGGRAEMFGPPRMGARFAVPFSPVPRSHSVGPCNSQYANVQNAQKWFPAARSILGSSSGPDLNTATRGSSNSDPGSVLRMARLAIYEEMSDPMYGLVTCDGFKMDDRMSIRVFANVEDNGKIGVDPENRELCVVEKKFSSPSEAELYKLAMEKSFYGSPQSRVSVQLMGSPPISRVGAEAAGQSGSKGETKRGRPRKLI